MLDKELQEAVSLLIDRGILKRDVLLTTAGFVRANSSDAPSFESNNGSEPPAPPVTRERAKRGGTRGPRKKFEITESELQARYQTDSAKNIAEEYGVSVATVNNRLQQFGIKKEGRAVAKKKKKSQKAAQG